MILPTDHYVEDEARLRDAIVDAIDEVQHHHERTVLVGSSPSGDDAECGWIVPRRGGRMARASRVATFIEKPERDVACRLVRDGAVVNTLIMVATIGALLKLFARAVPELVEKLDSWSLEQHDDLDSLYRVLPTIDFSREVLEGSCDLLSVVRVTGCGWMDLGTRARLDTCRRRLRTRTSVAMPHAVGGEAVSHPTGIRQSFGSSHPQGSAL
jgi:mannose-1-phosphate guanylyltransferase